MSDGHKAFAVLVQELNDGRVHSKLSAEFAELLQAVRDRRRAGSLKLSIKVLPATKSGDVDKVTIRAQSSVDLPEPDAPDDFFWLTEEAELSRNHPRQRSLELREAPRPDIGPLKEVSN